MKCPHCNYQYMTYTDDGEQFDYCGDFYVLPIKMERESQDNRTYIERTDLYACPACGKTFIEQDLHHERLEIRSAEISGGS